MNSYCNHTFKSCETVKTYAVAGVLLTNYYVLHTRKTTRQDTKKKKKGSERESELATGERAQIARVVGSTPDFTCSSHAPHNLHCDIARNESKTAAGVCFDPTDRPID